MICLFFLNCSVAFAGHFKLRSVNHLSGKLFVFYSFSDDDDDMEEDNDEGWNDFDTEKKSSVSEKDGMMGVISLQHFDGSWSPSEELQKILNLTEEKLTMKYKVCII